MADLGVTPRETADAAKIRRDRFAEFLAGAAVPNANEAFRLAYSLGVNVRALAT